MDSVLRGRDKLKNELGSRLSEFAASLAEMRELGSTTPTVAAVHQRLRERAFPSVRRLAEFARNFPASLDVQAARALKQALTDGREVGLASCAIQFGGAVDETKLAELRDLARQCEATAAEALQCLSTQGVESPPLEPPRHEEESLLEFLNGFYRKEPIRVTVIRAEPTTWRGREIAGTLDTFERPISESDIGEQFGGGKYKLRILRREPGGSFLYAAHRTVKIPGEPKADGRVESDAVLRRCGLVHRALDVTERSLGDARHRTVEGQTDAQLAHYELRREVDGLVRKRRDQLSAATNDGATSNPDVAIGNEVALLALHERHLADLDQLLASADAHHKRQADLNRSALRHLESAYEARIRALELAQTVFGERPKGRSK